MTNKKGRPKSPFFVSTLLCQLYGINIASTADVDFVGFTLGFILQY